MDAAALIDCSVPILDISAGLSVDPLSGRELDHYLKGSPSPRYSLSPFGLLLMDRRVYVPEYRPERGNLHIRGLQAKHDHPTEVTSVTTKHWSDYVATTFGPAYGRTREVRLTVRPVRPQQNLSPSSLRLAAAFTGPGAPMELYQYGLCRAFTHV